MRFVSIGIGSVLLCSAEVLAESNYEPVSGSVELGIPGVTVINATYDRATHSLTAHVANGNDGIWEHADSFAEKYPNVLRQVYHAATVDDADEQELGKRCGSNYNQQVIYDHASNDCTGGADGTSYLDPGSCSSVSGGANSVNICNPNTNFNSHVKFYNNGGCRSGADVLYAWVKTNTCQCFKAQNIYYQWWDWPGCNAP